MYTNAKPDALSGTVQATTILDSMTTDVTIQTEPTTTSLVTEHMTGPAPAVIDSVKHTAERGRASIVYLLQCGRRTYVGATIDLAHRLRQHNGEIRGGAVQTARVGPWVVSCTVSGFRTFSEALKFEYAWRRVGRRVSSRGVNARRDALAHLLVKERWSSTSPLASDVPLTIVWAR